MKLYPKTTTWEELRGQILSKFKEERNGYATIAPFEYEDDLTGHTLGLKTSPFYSVLSVDNREYYFVRETGEFDGVGTPVDGVQE